MPQLFFGQSRSSSFILGTRYPNFRKFSVATPPVPQTYPFWPFLGIIGGQKSLPPGTLWREDGGRPHELQLWRTQNPKNREFWDINSKFSTPKPLKILEKKALLPKCCRVCSFKGNFDLILIYTVILD